MLNITIGGIRCKLSLLFPAVLLYLLYLDQSGMTLFCFSAAFIHEGGHLLAAYVLRNRPKELVISCFGMRLVMNDSLLCSASDETMIAFAGPAVNVIASLVFFALPVDPLYAKIHLIMAVFNLLPIIPLDGGRAVRALLVDRLYPLHGKRIETVIFFAVWLPLVALGIGLMLHPIHNVTLLIVSLYLLFIKLFYNGN